jgi:citrate synthase
MDKKASLSLPDGRAIDLPVLTGSIGPDVVDIRALYGKTGVFTYDPGFLSTASCNSTITYIDGDAGLLLYRGYPIEQLAQHCDFLEVCYLLLNGELPNTAQKTEFVDIVMHHTMVHEQINRFFTGFRRDAHPMATLVGVVGRAFRVLPRRARHQRPAAPHDLGVPADREDADDRRDGLQVLDRPAVHVSEERPVVHRELHAHDVRGAGRGIQGEPGAGAGDGPDLHPARGSRAERVHFDVRLAGSSGANPFACISAGIACLWGPAHGGANEACLEMLEEIGDVSKIGEFIRKVKDKASGVR